MAIGGTVGGNLIIVGEHRDQLFGLSSSSTVGRRRQRCG
jgi:hypothetical protein